MHSFDVEKNNVKFLYSGTVPEELLGITFRSSSSVSYFVLILSKFEASSQKKAWLCWTQKEYRRPLGVHSNETMDILREA